jgi:hypothetical protein
MSIVLQKLCEIQQTQLQMNRRLVSDWFLVCRHLV